MKTDVIVKGYGDQISLQACTKEANHLLDKLTGSGSVNGLHIVSEDNLLGVCEAIRAAQFSILDVG